MKRCLHSCEESLVKLSRKSQDLRKYGQPEGLRQKAWTELQKSWYPFRFKTLAKLREIVADTRERLELAVQVLHLDVSTTVFLDEPDPSVQARGCRENRDTISCVPLSILSTSSASWCVGRPGGPASLRTSLSILQCPPRISLSRCGPTICLVLFVMGDLASPPAVHDLVAPSTPHQLRKGLFALRALGRC